MATRKRRPGDSTTDPNEKTSVARCYRCEAVIYSDQPVYCPSKLGISALLFSSESFDCIDCIYSAVSDAAGGTAGALATFLRNHIRSSYPNHSALRYIPKPQAHLSPSVII